MRLYADLHADCDRVPAKVSSERLSGSQAAFWRAAGQVCTALRRDDDAMWNAARQSWLTEGGRSHSPRDCFEASVRDAMLALEQSAGPTFSRSGISLVPGEGYACPPERLTVSPSTGAAGTPVTITWATAQWLATTMRVRFAAVEAVWTQRETAASATYVAPAGLTGTVDVVLDFGGGRRAIAGAFTYAPAKP